MKSNLQLFLTICIIAIFTAFNVQAQIDLNNKIPIDKDLRIGKLTNGMTYYIRKNNKPENRAEMRLFLKAGSIVEDDDQLGLAHLVEHMCFNGTKNFEKNELIHYLQSIGMRMGADINGFTSFDKTGYMITVPTDSAEVFEKGMLIMEDWAHGVTFDHEEIDKERGIVLEEWRLGQGSGKRMRDKYFPVLFKDSKYAERLPIGTREIIENASYETIKKFYSDWYRPDLMAFVIVGDIDVDQTEKMIKSHFGGIKNPKKPRERENFSVPDHKENLVSIVSDKENSYTQVTMFYKHPAIEYKTLEDLKNSLITQLFTGMVNQRLMELKEQPNPPFIYSGSGIGGVKSKSFYQSYLMVKEDGIERGVKTIVEENEKIKKYGFTAGELDRYKKTMMKRFENDLKEKEKTESQRYTWEYMNHFLEQKPIPGKAYMYEFSKSVFPEITLDDVNKVADKLITNKNRVLVLQGIDKEGVTLPTETQLLSYVDDIDKSSLTPYKDKAIASKLLSKEPIPGTIVSETKIEEIEGVQWTLSNGVKVILKQTDFKNDEIFINATSNGGQSLYDVEDHFNAKYASTVVNKSGFGPFNKADLRKFLAGKKVKSGTNISPEFEFIYSNTSNDDLEVAMQLVYLGFTAPRFDKEAILSSIEREKEMVRNQMNQPIAMYFKIQSEINFQNHPRASSMMEMEDFDKIDIKRAFEIYKERFSNASDFTYVIVGSFDFDAIRPLVCKYVASLPSNDNMETSVDMGIRGPESKVIKNVYKGTDPKSFISLRFEQPANATNEEAYLFGLIGEYLNLRYFDVLREEMSGIYGSRVSSKIHSSSYKKAEVGIIIPCAPKNVDLLKDAALQEIKDLQQNGISKDYLDKIIETKKKDKESNLKKNDFWLSQIVDLSRANESFDEIPKQDSFIDIITSDAIKSVANKFIDIDVYAQVVLYPESENPADNNKREN